MIPLRYSNSFDFPISSIFFTKKRQKTRQHNDFVLQANIFQLQNTKRKQKIINNTKIEIVSFDLLRFVYL